MERDLLQLSRVLLEGEGGEEPNATDTSAACNCTEDEKHESSAALAIVVFMALLGVTMTIGHLLDRKKISWMSEAGAALLLGIVIGYVGKVAAKDSPTFHAWLQFQNYFFYFALLPPIIFEAAYGLNVTPFFNNIGAICAYAFLGTTMSAIIVGLTMWIAGLIGICFKVQLLEGLLFGSLISATDPVTVLAVFQRLQADYDLYTLVFGESIFNDAVAIVLYQSLLQFRKGLTAKGFFGGFLTFVEIFFCSMLIGVGIGMTASLVFRTKKLRNKHHPLEASLVVLFALSSFFIGEALSFSGIVAILFCGIAMSRYTRPNLTKFGERLSMGFFKMLATVSETFVFIYIGTTLFLHEEAWNNGMAWSFLFVALCALAYSRLANIQANTALVNYLRPPERAIPKSHRFMLWWSGLRGAIAFALAIQGATSDFMEERREVGQVFLTTTFFIILLTVLINGGATSYLLSRLGLRGMNGTDYQRLGTLPPSMDFDESTRDGDRNGSPSANQVSWNSKTFMERLKEMNRTGVGSKLKHVDEQYLAKFFGADLEMVEKRNEDILSGKGTLQQMYIDDGDEEDEGGNGELGMRGATKAGEGSRAQSRLPGTREVAARDIEGAAAPL